VPQHIEAALGVTPSGGCPTLNNTVCRSSCRPSSNRTSTCGPPEPWD
jgi:hypothetical protein